MLFLCSVVLKNLCSYFSNTLALAASQVAQVVRICLAIQETREAQAQTLGWEGPLEVEMVPHCSIPAWKFPWAEAFGGLQSRGPQRVDMAEHNNQQQ